MGEADGPGQSSIAITVCLSHNVMTLTIDGIDMQPWIKYLAAIALLSPAIGTAQTPLYTYTSESLLDNQCVDTAPVGDGFGWDGICTCIANPADIPYEWESTTTLLAGQLIASTTLEINSCVLTGG